MEADLGISKWAIVALVVAMIAVGAMGLVFRSTDTQPRASDRAPAAAPAAQAR